MVHLKTIQLLFICIPVVAMEVLKVEQCQKNLHKSCKCSSCLYGGKVIVECTDLISEELELAVKTFNESELCIFSLRNSNISNIEGYVIRNNFKTEIISLQNVRAVAFSLFDAFLYMEDMLLKIELRNVSSFFFNINDSGEHFTQLRVFRQSDCSEERGWDNVKPFSIVPRLPKYLQTISINKCKIKFLDDHFFTRFTDLSELDLSENLLESVKRSSLPTPAYYLSSYVLSFNPITSLPDDMFQDMPALEEISLEGTSLQTLHYSIFQSVLSQLQSLAISGIPLNCGCEASWLLMNFNILSDDEETTEDIKCAYPYSLENRELDTLMPMDMCMNCEVFLLKNTTYNEDTTIDVIYNETMEKNGDM